MNNKQLAFRIQLNHAKQKQVILPYENGVTSDKPLYLTSLLE